MFTSKGNKGGYATARFTATGAVYPNHPTLGANSAGETVNTLRIVNLKWSGQWAIARGANTVMNLTGSGNIDLQEDGMQLELNDFEAAANAVATLTGSGSLLIKFHKQSTYDPEYPTGN